jgi:hypothetical protein
MRLGHPLPVHFVIAGQSFALSPLHRVLMCLTPMLSTKSFTEDDAMSDKDDPSKVNQSNPKRGDKGAAGVDGEVGGEGNDPGAGSVGSGGDDSTRTAGRDTDGKPKRP